MKFHTEVANNSNIGVRHFFIFFEIKLVIDYRDGVVGDLIKILCQSNEKKEFKNWSTLNLKIVEVGILNYKNALTSINHETNVSGSLTPKLLALKCYSILSLFVHY